MVYNTFPWPTEVEKKRRFAVEKAARAVLEARKPYLPPDGEGTLADLYDPLTMPTKLSQAHTELDLAVDRCYRSERFRNSRERVEHLFALYEQATLPLLPGEPKKRKGTRRPVLTKKNPATPPEIADEPDGKAIAESNSKLPKWYLEAFKPHQSSEERGEVVTDSLDIIYDQLDELLCDKRFEECDEFLASVAAEPERSPISTLVGVLTMTLPALKRLPNRAHLRDVVRKRLLATGQNADAALKGL
jgi:hypothetical protein